MLTDSEFRNKLLQEIKSLKEDQYLIIDDFIGDSGHPNYPLSYTTWNGKSLSIYGVNLATSRRFRKSDIEHLTPENCGRIIILNDTIEYLRYVRDNFIIPWLEKSLKGGDFPERDLLNYSKSNSGLRVLTGPSGEESYFIAVTADMQDYYYMYWSPSSNSCRLESCCGYPRDLEEDKFLSQEESEIMIETVKNKVYDAIMPCRYKEIESVHI